MRRKGISKLDVKIRYSKKLHSYCLTIDGDEFWCDTYEHAVCRLIYLLSRDEFNYRAVLPKYHNKPNLVGVNYEDLPY